MDARSQALTRPSPLRRERRTIQITHASLKVTRCKFREPIRVIGMHFWFRRIQLGSGIGFALLARPKAILIAAALVMLTVPARAESQCGPAKLSGVKNAWPGSTATWRR